MSVENVRSDPVFDPPVRGDMVDSFTGSQHKLDSDVSRKLHGRLLGTFLYERRRQAINRYQMALDQDYYDGVQLTDEEIQELLSRDQIPLVYNLVARTADWVIGTEKRTRIDHKVLARNNSQGEVEAARTKTDVLKYLSDVNHTPFRRSEAFREAVICGLGWLEDGVRGEPDEDPIYSRNEFWRNILYDSHGVERDCSDMLYLHRFKWLDVDIAQSMFPDRKNAIDAAALGAIQAEDAMVDEWYLGNRLTGQDYLVGQLGRYQQAMQGFVDNTRDRVKLIETWYRKPVVDQVIHSKALPTFHGDLYNPKNDDHVHAVMIGEASLIQRQRLAVFYAIMTEGNLLACGRSPYKHNRFPFTPIWYKRRGRDHAPYGLIRNLRDPQDGFNKRMSKALFALSAYRVTADADAIDPKIMTWEDLRIEAGRQDAMIVKKKGSELKVEQDRGLAEGHMKMADMDASLILDSSGVTADNLGMQSNAQSGKAILAKQSEGSSVTAEIFDNLRFALQLQGELQLSLAEQFMTEEQVVMVTDAKGRAQWTKINEIEQLPDGTVRVKNDITASKAKFVIDEQDFNTSLRQASSEQLLDLAGKMGQINPMLSLRVIEMALEISNLPNRQELVKTIREMTGHQDPGDALTPEEKAQQEQAMAAQKQAEQAQQAMQQQASQAELDGKLALAQKAKAEADSIAAQAEKTRLETEQLKSGNGEADAKLQTEIANIKQRADASAAALQKTVLDLQAQIRQHETDKANRAEEIASKERVEAHKATKAHDATVRTAEIAAAPPPMEHKAHAESLADLMQAVHDMGSQLDDIDKKVADQLKGEQDERAKEAKETKQLLADAVKSVGEQVKKAVDAAEKSEKVQPLTPTVPPNVIVNINEGAVQVQAPEPTDKVIEIGGKTGTVKHVKRKKE